MQMNQQMDVGVAGMAGGQATASTSKQVMQLSSASFTLAGKSAQL